MRPLDARPAPSLGDPRTWGALWTDVLVLADLTRPAPCEVCGGHGTHERLDARGYCVDCSACDGTGLEPEHAECFGCGAIVPRASLSRGRCEICADEVAASDAADLRRRLRDEEVQP